MNTEEIVALIKHRAKNNLTASASLSLGVEEIMNDLRLHDGVADHVKIQDAVKEMQKSGLIAESHKGLIIFNDDVLR